MTETEQFTTTIRGLASQASTDRHAVTASGTVEIDGVEYEVTLRDTRPYRERFVAPSRNA